MRPSTTCAIICSICVTLQCCGGTDQETERYGGEASDKEIAILIEEVRLASTEEERLAKLHNLLLVHYRTSPAEDIDTLISDWVNFNLMSLSASSDVLMRDVPGVLQWTRISDDDLERLIDALEDRKPGRWKLADLSGRGPVSKRSRGAIARDLLQLLGIPVTTKDEYVAWRAGRRLVWDQDLGKFITQDGTGQAEGISAP